MKINKKTLLLFDIDGTLTKPRQQMSKDMTDFLFEMKSTKNIVLGVVGGSDFEKAKEQIGEDIFNIFDYVFSENGLIFYKNGNLSHSFSLLTYITQQELNEFVQYSQKYIDQLILPKKTSNFVEVRNSMINVSPVGRNCSQNERDDFEAFDNEHKIRQTMIGHLREHFRHLNFDYSVGGQISFDVFPKGNNKTFCLDYLTEFEDNIHFFGDKYEKGGNDYEIYIDSRVKSHAVKSYYDTIKICKDIVY